MSYSNLRISRVFAGVALAAAAAFFLSPAVQAQNGPPPRMAGHWRGGPGGMAFGHHGGAKVVTGAPYTAQAVTTMVDTLSNGSHITRQITATIARDSEGRTMRSQAFTGFAGSTNAQNGSTLVTIFDPVANQRIEYNTGAKRARIFILPAKSNESAGSGNSTPAPRHNRFNSSQVTVQTQSLGAQTISGVSAVGTQTTRTFAAGAIGNDQALQATEEEWYSPDLQIVVQSTRNDPRFGQSTYTLSNIQRAEPSASLFQVPAGFQTKTVDLPSRSGGQ